MDLRAHQVSVVNQAQQVHQDSEENPDLRARRVHRVRAEPQAPEEIVENQDPRVNQEHLDHRQVFTDEKLLNCSN